MLEEHPEKGREESNIRNKGEEITEGKVEGHRKALELEGVLLNGNRGGVLTSHRGGNLSLFRRREGHVLRKGIGGSSVNHRHV